MNSLLFFNSGLNLDQSISVENQSQDSFIGNQANLLEDDIGSLCHKKIKIESSETSQRIALIQNQDEMEEEKESVSVSHGVSRMSDAAYLDFQKENKSALESLREIFSKEFTLSASSIFRKDERNRLTEQAGDFMSFEFTEPKFGDFEVVEILGEGAHGCVVKIVKSDCDLTIKLFDREFQQQKFMNEAIALSVIQRAEEDIWNSFKFETFKSKKHYGIVIEPGLGSLRNFIEYLKARQRKLSPTELFIFIMTLLHACARLHGINLCHRDIKPENIVIDPKTFLPRLIDYSDVSDISKAKGDAGTKSYRIYDFYQMKGKIPKKRRDRRISNDYFALGKTLLEIAVPSKKIRTMKQIEDEMTELRKIKDQKMKIIVDGINTALFGDIRQKINILANLEESYGSIYFQEKDAQFDLGPLHEEWKKTFKEMHSEAFKNFMKERWSLSQNNTQLELQKIASFIDSQDQINLENIEEEKQSNNQLQIFNAEFQKFEEYSHQVGRIDFIEGLRTICDSNYFDLTQLTNYVNKKIEEEDPLGFNQKENVLQFFKENLNHQDRYFLMDGCFLFASKLYIHLNEEIRNRIQQFVIEMNSPIRKRVYHLVQLSPERILFLMVIDFCEILKDLKIDLSKLIGLMDNFQSVIDLADLGRDAYCLVSAKERLNEDLEESENEFWRRLLDSRIIYAMIGFIIHEYLPQVQKNKSGHNFVSKINSPQAKNIPGRQSNSQKILDSIMFWFQESSEEGKYYIPINLHAANREIYSLSFFGKMLGDLVLHHDCLNSKKFVLKINHQKGSISIWRIHMNFRLSDGSPQDSIDHLKNDEKWNFELESLKNLLLNSKAKDTLRHLTLELSEYSEDFSLKRLNKIQELLSCLKLKTLEIRMQKQIQITDEGFEPILDFLHSQKELISLTLKFDLSLITSKSIESLASIIVQLKKLEELDIFFCYCSGIERNSMEKFILKMKESPKLAIYLSFIACLGIKTLVISTGLLNELEIYLGIEKSWKEEILDDDENGDDQWNKIVDFEEFKLESIGNKTIDELLLILNENRKALNHKT